MLQGLTLGLITQRSQVQILTPLPIARPRRIYSCAAFCVSSRTKLPSQHPCKAHRHNTRCRFALLLDAPRARWALHSSRIVGGHSKNTSPRKGEFRTVVVGLALQQDFRGGCRPDYSNFFLLPVALCESAQDLHAPLAGNPCVSVCEVGWGSLEPGKNPGRQLHHGRKAASQLRTNGIATWRGNPFVGQNALVVCAAVSRAKTRRPSTTNRSSDINPILRNALRHWCKAARATSKMKKASTPMEALFSFNQPPVLKGEDYDT